MRYISGASPDTPAPLLQQDLEDCPSEFREIPSLIGMHQRAQLLIRALVADEASGAACAVLNATAFQEF